MNKNQLITAVSESTGIKQTTVKMVLGELLNQVVETICKNESIIIPGFGSFKAVISEARDRQNPQNREETIRVPRRLRPKFKIGKQFTEACNEALEAEDHTP